MIKCTWLLPVLWVLCSLGCQDRPERRWADEETFDSEEEADYEDATEEEIEEDPATDPAEIAPIVPAPAVPPIPTPIAPGPPPILPFPPPGIPVPVPVPVPVDAPEDDFFPLACGDAELSADEECDDGNLVNGDGCSEFCRTEVCGNRILDVGESCEDGNTQNGDGCSSTCEVESPSQAGEACGNGVVDEDEGCDDGNENPNDACTNACTIAECGDAVIRLNVEVCDDGNNENTDNCTNDCKSPSCGDGFVQPGNGEECDDDNTSNTDTCTNDCKNASCPDGFVQPGELCDDGDLNNDNECNNSCTLNTCGNGEVNFQEECDDLNQVNDDGCTNACTLPKCGDGIQQVSNNEACDDGNVSPFDFCNNCQFTTCGDTIIQSVKGETCDDGNNVPFDSCNDCQTPFCGDGFAQPALNETCDDSNTNNNDLCTNDCQEASCLDGFIQPGELCDDGDFNNENDCNNECTTNSCGNGILTAPEVCDDGNSDNSDFCTNRCTRPVCGDGIVQIGEACDDGNDNDDDDCRNTCRVQTCGNGTVQPPEVCDLGILNNDEGECTNRCLPAICGDGFFQPSNGEQCDDGNDTIGDSCGLNCLQEVCGNGVIDPFPFQPISGCPEALYGATLGNELNASRLYSISKATGLASLVSDITTIDGPVTHLSAMDFSTTGEFFAIGNVVDVTEIDDNISTALLRLNCVEQDEAGVFIVQATVLGRLAADQNAQEFTDMTFYQTGMLFVHVDPAIGDDAIEVVALDGTRYPIGATTADDDLGNSLAFGAGATLYNTGDTNLYTIDPNTGIASFLSTIIFPIADSPFINAQDYDPIDDKVYVSFANDAPQHFVGALDIPTSTILPLGETFVQVPTDFDAIAVNVQVERCDGDNFGPLNIGGISCAQDCQVAESACGDEFDNDFDGLIDCADLDCSLTALCLVEADCNDGLDNDSDGETDCQDPGCVGTIDCETELDCFNGLDDDGDGFIDCSDPGCEENINCTALAFVTSTTYTGDLKGFASQNVEGCEAVASGLLAGDCICEQIAQSGSDPNISSPLRHWQAYLVVNTQLDPTDDLPARPYRRADLQKIADDIQGVDPNSQLLVALNQDENGSTIPGDPDMSGLARTWVGQFLSTCGDWESAMVNGIVGNANATTGWDAYSNAACANSYRLYCFQSNVPVFGP